MVYAKVYNWTDIVLQWLFYLHWKLEAVKIMLSVYQYISLKHKEQMIWLLVGRAQFRF